MFFAHFVSLSLSLMQKTNSGWKVLLAILSLLLTVLIWERGLQESFNRPSVSPKLALNQREMAILAAPSLPDPLSPLLIGENPKLDLRSILEELLILKKKNT